MAEINIGKAPGNKAVLPFYATGAVAFLVLCTVMLCTPQSFTQHYFTPHLLTIVHIAALGWGTMVIFGAAHQLLPVICEQDLYSEKMASASWYTLTAGIILLTWKFWNLDVGWMMITGGSLIVFSVLLFVINVWKTTQICTRYTAQKLLITGSAFWLLFTVSVGLLLAINLSLTTPMFRVSHLEVLKLHAHMGIAGWFLQLITGVSTKLVPMFLLGKSSKEYLLRNAFVFQNLGLILFLLDGYFFAVTGRVIIYAAIVLAGIIFWLLYLYDVFRNRLRKRIELLMKHTFLSFLSLILAVLLIPVVYYSDGYRFTMVYGTLIFLGWITNIILGKTFKTLPFIIWNNQYKNHSGKAKIPLPKDLYHEKLTIWQFRLFIAAFLVFALGLVLQHLTVIRIGLVLWLAVAVMYCLNVFKLLLHKTKI